MASHDSQITNDGDGMALDARIFIAGHRGLVGSALMRRLQAGGYSNLITRKHAELDLTNQAAVNAFFAEEYPEYVFLVAGKVGGIHANNTFRADFIYQNVVIQSNVIHAAYVSGVKKLLFLGSSCIYPKHCPQPIKEEYLLSGKLEPTNEPYAVAKIAGVKMCDAYNQQHGTNFICAMPTNLYGPGDTYDLENSHIIPALILKMHEAKSRGNTEVVVWGTGKPRREFLYSDDLGDACVFLMERWNSVDVGEFINIGYGQDQSIDELARLIAEVVGFKGRIIYDTSKPDGTPQKLLDSSHMSALGWRAMTGLREGLKRAYQDYQNGASSLKTTVGTNRKW